MKRELEQREVLNQVGSALLDKGEGYSVGKLVADLEGDGTAEDDPYTVRDRHFLQDLGHIDEWRDEPRDPAEVEALLDLFTEYWAEREQMRFCEIVCNAHLAENGLGDFDPDAEGGPYEEPLTELTDEQLKGYLERKLEREG